MKPDMVHVWVVEFWENGVSMLLSAHADQRGAFAARDAYLRNPTFGGVSDDYWVHAVRFYSSEVSE